MTKRGEEVTGIDAEIAKAWPRRWAKANDPSRPKASKRRNVLRRAWKNEKALTSLRLDGASCSSCRSFEQRGGTAPKGEMICAAHSDFYGDVLARPGGLCLSYAPAQKGKTHEQSNG
jgi:hypothetical protein